MQIDLLRRRDEPEISGGGRRSFCRLALAPICPARVFARAGRMSIAGSQKERTQGSRQRTALRKVIPFRMKAAKEVPAFGAPFAT